MPAATDCRDAISAALTDFATYPLAEAARRFFAVLGYKSDRRLPVATTRAFCESFDPHGTLTTREREQLDRLTSLHFLFQLTDTELTSQRDLLSDSGAVENTRIHSYLFFAAELPAGTYTRTFLAGIARAINKPLPMPALVLIRHGDALSLAILHRRLNKREADKDVLEKATLIKDIRCGGPDAEPIRAHLEILNDFVLANLDASHGIHNFVSLHAAWQKQLGQFALNDRFYTEIADWYFWAQHLIAEGRIVPPRDVDTDPERSLFLIRLLTRLIFCWFLLEKRLLPPALFREKDLQKLLKSLAPGSPDYYRAVLQNLFFATLNQPHEDEDGKPCRGFRKRSAAGRDPNRGITNLWRYEDAFRDPAQWEAVAKNIPFLNGGLFDCLDRIYQSAELTPNSRLDGFSDNPKESAILPNDLFFGPERFVDLSKDYGEDDKRTARSKRARVRGLIHILSRYKFTIEENTPLDEEIALDPELLGKVFENLLASYNPETSTTARKATGSFYTPREVVSFMVDEALLAYLDPILGGADSDARLRALFAASAEHYDSPFDDAEMERLVAALDEVKILDPACGSGAFPMGALHRLVDLLRKLDPENKRWEVRQRARLAEDKARATALADAKLRQEALDELTQRERELAPIFNASRFDRDYARKLFLIENAIFGADLQPVAVQIAKLRFFIALICDQQTHPKAENQGVLPLPNLETRIVAANSLLPIGSAVAGSLGQADLLDQRLDRLRAALREVRHEHFQARTPARKRRCRERDAALRAELAGVLRESGLPAATAKKLATWDPYNQNESAPFFDPAWMFGTAYTRPNTVAATFRGEMAGIVNAAQKQQELSTRAQSAGRARQSSGFDLVTGNPPYVRQEKIKDKKDELKPHYAETFTGTADLYVYFYDRALQLLRPGGILSFITSNKWYRAAYGEKLRAHLGRTTTLLHAIDFGDAPVFTAIAYPTIVIARKAAPPLRHTFRALNWDPETPNTEIANFAKFYEAKSTRIPQSSLTSEGWRFQARKGQDLLGKIRAAGTPLGEFLRGRFYNGVKAGYNDAFVVDRATRDQLIKEDASSAKVLKQFLRGRDVRPWTVESADEWIIYIPWHFPLHEDSSITSASAKAEAEFKKHYPAIFKHLSRYREKLAARDRAETGIRYEWYVHARPRDDLADVFAAPKILYPDITMTPRFALDSSGAYPDCTLYLIPAANEWFLSVLNSKLGAYFLSEVTPRIRGGFLRFKSIYVEQLPIPNVVRPHVAPLVLLQGIVTFLASRTQADSAHPRDPLMLDYYEELLNALVYELYLPEELHAAGLKMFERVAAAGLPALDTLPKAPAARLIALREKFEECHAPAHPLRAALQKLHTLDPIRIIEGKA